MVRLWQHTEMRSYVRDHLHPFLLRRVGLAFAPRTRFLMGQRSYLVRELRIETVLDVGANVGQYASELRRSGFRGAIHSFEPGGDAFATLAKTAEGDLSWKTHHKALAAEPGSATLQSWPSGSIFASLQQPVVGMVEMLGQPQAETVTTQRLDAWLAQHLDVDPDRTLLKVDVQGSERDVLAGAGKMLGRFALIEVEAPLVELYAGEASLPELLTLLSDAGFTPVSVMTERFHIEWLGAADVDILAIRRDLSRLPSYR